jgi:hypothetical protein
MLLLIHDTGVTFEQMIGELASPEYDCMGMTAMRVGLAAHKAAGGGQDRVVVTNSGETHFKDRPEKHFGRNGNTLPVMLFASVQKFQGTVRFPLFSTFQLWASGLSEIDQATQAELRMTSECVGNQPVLSQQHGQPGKPGGGNDLCGSNVISGGKCRGNPLRAWGRLMCGPLGGVPLWEIEVLARGDCDAVLGTAYLIDQATFHLDLPRS